MRCHHVFRNAAIYRMEDGPQGHDFHQGRKSLRCAAHAVLSARRRAT